MHSSTLVAALAILIALSASAPAAHAQPSEELVAALCVTQNAQVGSKCLDQANALLTADQIDHAKWGASLCTDTCQFAYKNYNLGYFEQKCGPKIPNGLKEVIRNGSMLIENMGKAACLKDANPPEKYCFASVVHGSTKKKAVDQETACSECTTRLLPVLKDMLEKSKSLPEAMANSSTFVEARTAVELTEKTRGEKCPASAQGASGAGQVAATSVMAVLALALSVMLLSL
ncbi:hypothetical protein BCR44DRAFT_1483975 [Catenaria anguillulae PL171]|uniref:Secreted protein n=1 Tax=Catenaria anguillulae PL171 TaxID=765915 RepID=A0A1Y2HUQ8_9FUNG|nr:hypothetical protein BCR44DRAFT_1483975 [Catenaria anguillulae PL171]